METMRTALWFFFKFAILNRNRKYMYDALTAGI